MSAALEAGATRFRPALMTVLAMIIEMVPMALGLGDGGERNAALGRVSWAAFYGPMGNLGAQLRADFGVKCNPLRPYLHPSTGNPRR